MPLSLNFKEAVKRLPNFLKFGFVASGAFALDFSLFIVLYDRLGSAFYANIISVTLASGYNFFVASRLIFDREHNMIWARYSFYLCYFVLAIAFFSWIIERGSAAFDLHPGFTKILIVPISFCIHYLVIRTLIETPVHGQVPSKK